MEDAGMMMLVAGFAAGILSGMGVGGGMILIPALTLFEGVEQHVAQTVNLFYFIPTAAAALAVHIKNKNIDKKAAVKLAACGAAFALLGSYLASELGAESLKRFFAVYIIASGVREIFVSLMESPKSERDGNTIIAKKYEKH